MWYIFNWPTLSDPDWADEESNVGKSRRIQIERANKDNMTYTLRDGTKKNYEEQSLGTGTGIFHLY
jgi:hypothetical protein